MIATINSKQLIRSINKLTHLKITNPKSINKTLIAYNGKEVIFKNIKDFRKDYGKYINVGDEQFLQALIDEHGKKEEK